MSEGEETCQFHVSEMWQLDRKKKRKEKKTKGKEKGKELLSSVSTVEGLD